MTQLHPCRVVIVLVALVLASAASALAAPKAQAPRKIVFLAGAPDGHGKGTHEYAKDLQLLKACLDTAANVKGIRTEVHLNGWPKDVSTLDDAAVIVVHSTGSNAGKHPLLKDKRLEHLGKLMAKGVGLVCMHYTLYMPNDRGASELIKWIGGYYDYQKKYSTHSVTTKNPPAAKPVSPDHEISRGWKAFTIPNEYYIRLRFGKSDKRPAGDVPGGRLVPILTTMLPVGKPEKQVIAWAVERTDGGRGFAFTGGHFHKNWQNDDLRKMILNAILWTAKVPVPKGGVQSAIGPSKPAEGKLNGEKVVDLQLDKSPAKDRPLTGYVGLQEHGLPLWFRNVRIRELPAKGK